MPGFLELVRGRTVLDYGCGPGWQAVAIRKQGEARRVVGVDVNARWLEQGRALSQSQGCQDTVSFTSSLGSRETFDVVLSLNAFEHFGDPSEQLRRMARAVNPGGRLIISFAEPWYSHSGSHMGFFTKVPWVNVLFGEETVMRVRARYRADGARHYEEVEGGLNRMTVAKFERIVRASGLRVEHLTLHATRRLPLVTRLPVLRELLTAAVTCIMCAVSGEEGEGGGGCCRERTL